MVAERAGASIGTVYRYFPDRIAVVEALAVRCVQRLVDRVSTVVEKRALGDWHESVDVVVDVLVDMYRSEPGFRAIRFGDSDTADRALATESRRPLADQLVACMVDRFGVERTADLEFAVEVATETGSALIARAFFSDPAGDERFVGECRTLVTTYLERALAPRA
jgi:AcrR family transcriptional regulator